ncbi:glycoside hydrolase family 66 protein [Bacillus taeanensis]|nr:glycoside hydrolase family 66 protein [Bacillus taeanensis]
MSKKLLFFLLITSIIIGIIFIITTSNDKKKREDAPAIQSLITDKAQYSPENTVSSTLILNKKSSEKIDVKVQYWHLNELIESESFSVTQEKQVEWKWQAPPADYKGYLMEVSLYMDDQQVDRKTIGIDVSSDWSKFPRYGYLSDFSGLPKSTINQVIEKLNRYHVNGLQFYDWHFQHHQPLKMNGDLPVSSWLDIANRPISLETIQQYIDHAHEKNMKAMAYNLLYGAFKEAEKDGVKEEWRLFKDQQMDKHDYHPLPKDWQSDIFLVNPGNEEWQQYLFDQQNNVFQHLNFDGWHIDQLGDRGRVFNAAGEEVHLPETFEPFLKSAKKHMNQELVMNAVNQYGQWNIAQSPVEFLYTEVWSPYDTYGDLKKIIDENEEFSHGKYNTVLAAYMNYDLSNQKGVFNEPGILLTDAVIFAAGGAHIELGEHLLSKEYFPHNNLTVSPSLQEKLKTYYDFLVAYENVLRDEVVPSETKLSTENWVHLRENPEKGTLWTFSKKKGKREIFHLINLFDASTLEWRDTDGQQKEPNVRKELQLSFQTDRIVDKIWFASPDVKDGVSIPLTFNQENEKVTFEVPSLKYWDMVVVEYKN